MSRRVPRGPRRKPDQVEHDQRVGALIRQARQDRGLSQQALATVLTASGRPGWDAPRICRLERGQRSIQLYEATALSDVLGIDGAELHPHLRWAKQQVAPAQPRQRRGTKNTVVQPNVPEDDGAIQARCRYLERLCDELVARGRVAWDYNLLWQIIFTPEQLEHTIRLAEAELEDLRGDGSGDGGGDAPTPPRAPLTVVFSGDPSVA